MASELYETLSNKNERAAGYINTNIGVKGQYLGLGVTTSVQQKSESPLKHQNYLTCDNDKAGSTLLPPHPCAVQEHSPPEDPLHASDAHSIHNVPG